jgi:cobalamin biosynthesis protein CobT
MASDSDENFIEKDTSSEDDDFNNEEFVEELSEEEGDEFLEELSEEDGEEFVERLNEEEREEEEEDVQQNTTVDPIQSLYDNIDYKRIKPQKYIHFCFDFFNRRYKGLETKVLVAKFPILRRFFQEKKARKLSKRNSIILEKKKRGVLPKRDIKTTVIFI